MSNTRKATAGVRKAAPAKKATPPAEAPEAPAADVAAFVQAVTDAPAAEPEQMDELDRELAELRALLEAKEARKAAEEAAKADPRRAEIERLKALLLGDDATAEAAPEDEKDRTIRLLREELAQKTSTESGYAEEMRKAVQALQDQINRMQSGTGLIPVPKADGPDPYLYGALLANGEVIYTQHPVGTHHESTQDGLMPIKSHWLLDPSQHARAEAWAEEQTALAAERAQLVRA